MSNDNEYQELSIEYLLTEEPEKTPVKKKISEKICRSCSRVISQCLERKEKNVFRKAFSEVNLLEILEKDFKPDTTYHCISGGDIDSLSYLKHIIKQQDLEYLLLSTWCMADDDVLMLREWVEKKKIGRLDAYVGEIFPGSYAAQYKKLKDVVNLCGGRVCVFRNHAKIYAGKGDKFAFAIESSANVNTNPRTENTTITQGIDIFIYYKNFFDEINSFNKDYDKWVKYEI